MTIWLEDAWGELASYFTKETTEQTTIKEDDTVKIILAPGRYSRSTQSVTRAVRQYKNTGATVLIGTEYQNRERYDAFVSAFGGQGFRGKGHDGLQEIAIAVKPDIKVMQHGSFEVGKLTYKRVGGAVAPPKGMTWVTLPNGLVVAGQHLANTQGNTRFAGRQARIDVYKESVRVTSQWALRQKHLVLGADFNANLGFPNPMRGYLDEWLEKAGLRRVKNQRGIVGFYVKGFRVRRIHSLGMNPSSDHPAIMLRGEVTK